MKKKMKVHRLVLGTGRGRDICLLIMTKLNTPVRKMVSKNHVRSAGPRPTLEDYEGIYYFNRLK